MPRDVFGEMVAILTAIAHRAVRVLIREVLRLEEPLRPGPRDAHVLPHERAISAELYPLWVDAVPREPRMNDSDVHGILGRAERLHDLLWGPQCAVLGDSGSAISRR